MALCLCDCKRWSNNCNSAFSPSSAVRRLLSNLLRNALSLATVLLPPPAMLAAGLAADAIAPLTPCCEQDRSGLLAVLGGGNVAVTTVVATLGLAVTWSGFLLVATSALCDRGDDANPRARWLVADVAFLAATCPPPTLPTFSTASASPRRRLPPEVLPRPLPHCDLRSHRELPIPRPRPLAFPSPACALVSRGVAAGEGNALLVPHEGPGAVREPTLELLEQIMRRGGTSCEFSVSMATPRKDGTLELPMLLPATRVLTPQPETSTPTGDWHVSALEPTHLAACGCTKWQGNSLDAPCSDVRGERPSRQALSRGNFNGDGDRARRETQPLLALLFWIPSSSSAAAADAAAAAAINAADCACMAALSLSSSLLPAPTAQPSSARYPEAVRAPDTKASEGDDPDFRMARGDGLRDAPLPGDGFPSALHRECGQANPAAPEAALSARKVSTNLPAGRPRMLPLGLRGTAVLSSGCNPSAPSIEAALLALLNRKARAYVLV
mmetsp:Transcript_81339/g.211393  ORF Transcript_81339/g.211393 Transcript_81339/m.211393 type:complete len:498 (-) Transcript_81339:87-1580(-)